MALQNAFEGEDVPLTISYEDLAGNAVAPAGASDSTGPTITVTSPNGTAVVDGTTMSEVTTGTYEHVWDTAASFDGTGTYRVEVSAEFEGETKIDRGEIRIE